jgi:hypothetical protein
MGHGTVKASTTIQSAVRMENAVEICRARVPTM